MGASNHSAFMDKWPTVISLIHPEDEFSFKEMRMWGQFKISSCCICDWCESREMGGRGSPRLPTPMVESFSADLIGHSRLLNCVYCLESRIKIVAYNTTSVGVGRRNRLFLVYM